ncbi:MAG: membrane protein insertase YidC [Rickettsiales bacterium TMED289]|nr:MAG: membrane protein insertase YidC [Rickettsiales bacterium TMED289]|tara:strand:+ start:1483 stop:3174 length:1692 start_codon:yes stop_codon:yes gene_type:complete
MDLKNIIAAIALSAAVIVLYGLFFAPDQEQLSSLRDSKNKELVEKSEAPKIEAEVQIKTISREDALKDVDRISFENEFIKGSISLRGGEIDDLELKTYNRRLNSEEKIQLLNPSSTNEGYTFNTGWATNSDINTPKSDTYWVVEGSNKLSANNPVKIYFENNDGIRFERIISIDEKYLFKVKQTIINNSKKTFKIYPYAIINRNNLPNDLTDFYILHEGYTFITGDNVEEVDYDEVVEKKFSKEGSSGVLIQGDKYWMTSIIPEQGRTFRFDLDYKNKYRASYIDIKGYETRPNTVVEHSVQSLIGAKEINQINKYKTDLRIEKLDLIVNYGVLYFIIVPMHKVLSYFFNFSGNYGYAIILLTILVRIIFFPLNQYSMKSMGKMKGLGPEIENLKARFKDDKQQLQKEMMKLYKVNGVNPASSCFPILIQIPIFFSLYKLLLLDLGMRHSPFIWVWQDLSAKDPLTIFNLFGLLPYSVPSFLEIGLLPVLMGSSMWLQMKLSPQPSGSDEMQKMQKKIFMLMPLFLTVILAPFAAGLILYWVCTNILTIIQQYIINRSITVKS